MTGFAQVLASGETLEDGLAVEVPSRWLQGRTAYGGFSSALALVAAQQVGGDLPPLRSAQLAMMAPLSGRIEAHAKVERQGRNATWVSAQITGDKGPAFTASFVFMGAIESTLTLDERPVPDDVVALEDAPPMAPDLLAPFIRDHFDVRLGVAMQGEREPDYCWWLRSRDWGTLDPMVEILLCGDGLPPGVLPMMPALVPVSSMHWQVNLLTALPQTRDGWWLLRSTGDFARHGCSSQRMAMWNAQGQAILAGMQSIALFG
ncbi:thioesterase family protein [Novosphingobium sp. PP1Y]|uniref:thioesterase family protein n=1 Tax=Novosphingobium sp. PP1Y TaxID=702113 RepID=UPI00020EEF39|nr:thioesterase family protein [Novosphingobium sp. PP1Y]CCA93730.1 conserved hypothetical protein [Novosphingobium sp. PP1Y]